MLTPTQQAAYIAATLKRIGKAPADDRHMFAAGLAHGIVQERARCAKVCQRIGADQRIHKLTGKGAWMCKDAIESPTEPPNA